MDESAEAEVIPLEVSDRETRQMLGLFDAPAFARRGLEVEYGLSRLHARCRRERAEMLEMVRLRLRQWSAAADGPDRWATAFSAPIAPLWPLCEIDPPTTWGTSPRTPRRLRAIARDLIASVDRFNRRWGRFLAELDLGPVNALIERYNRYYVLEKECVLGSSRLASRHFVPRSPVTAEVLLAEYPMLPAPVPAGMRRG